MNFQSEKLRLGKVRLGREQMFKQIKGYLLDGIERRVQNW